VEPDSKITLPQEKARLRVEALARRDALADRPVRDAGILARVTSHPAWAGAGTISCFVGVKSEVATLPIIGAALALGKRVGVPVVEQGKLVLYDLRALDELAPAPFGLLEPRAELRAPARVVDPGGVDLFLVPGVAFDRSGGRVGYGKGYYDGLLPRARAGVPLIGLGYEVQVVAEVPMGPSDVRLSALITG
jgi:5-formyltetrahydrofolate cyclo-ligase